MQNPKTGSVLQRRVFSHALNLPVKSNISKITFQLKATSVCYLPSSPVFSPPPHHVQLPLSPYLLGFLCSDLNCTSTVLSQQNSFNLSQTILIPFSTLQPFTAHPRPMHSSCPIPWFSVQGTLLILSPQVHSPGPHKISRFSGNLFNQSQSSLFTSAVFFHLVSIIFYPSHTFLSSPWLSDSAFLL